MPAQDSQHVRPGAPAPHDGRRIHRLGDGAAGPGSATRVTDPLIIVEVRSRSTAALDAGEKRAGYIRNPTLRHYLIVAIESRAVIHHARADGGTIATRIVRDFPLRLDPPGIALADPFA